MLRHTDAISYIQRQHTRKNSRAGIPFFFGAVPELLIAGQLQIGLFLVHLGLLKADSVRVRRAEKVEESLPQTGPQAVNIP